MNSQDIKVIIQKPDNTKELIDRYTLGVFQIIKNHISPENIDLLINELRNSLEPSHAPMNQK